MKQTKFKKVISIALLFSFIITSFGLTGCTADPQEELKQISFAYTLTEQDVQDTFDAITQLETYIDGGKNRKIVSAYEEMDEKTDYIVHQYVSAEIAYYSDLSDDDAYETYVEAEDCHMDVREEYMRVMKKLYDSDLSAKDKIHVTGKNANIKRFLTKLGFAQTKVKSVLIIGGGKITHYLGQDLIKNKYEVKIIEKDYNKCLELSELLPKATVIHGDGTSHEVLSEEGIMDSDVVISLTGEDEENIIISMYAYKQNAKKIIAKVNKESFVSLMETIDMATVVSPKDIIASNIVRYIRARNNSRGSNILTLHKLVNNQVEALEFIAITKSKVLNKKSRTQ